MPTDSALLIFVKYPEPGRVKTRLAATIGAELAAQLYHEFIRCTFEIARQLEVAARFVTFTPAERGKDLRKLFPGPWQWFAQADSTDLGVRIRRAIQHVQQQNHSQVLTIGTDSPSLPVAYLDQAVTALESHDLVLGPATDGGYYLIGLKSAPLELFSGIDWCTDRVFQQTLERATRLRMSVHQLPVWYDVDDLATLKQFCEESSLATDLLKKLRPFL